MTCERCNKDKLAVYHTDDKKLACSRCLTSREYNNGRGLMKRIYKPEVEVKKKKK